MAGDVARRLFSLPAWREVMAGVWDGRANRALSQLVSDGVAQVGDDATVGEAVAAAHAWMVRSYRCEHVFKNAVANMVVASPGGIAASTMLAEFRVGGSVADCVVVDGEGCAVGLEIKSVLDSPSRLGKQVDDYMSVFSRMAVVVDECEVERYVRVLAGGPVGVFAVDGSGGLVKVVDPVEDMSRLSVEAMFKSLRKAEYTRVVERLSGVTFDVPNCLHFRACFAVARQFTAAEFHAEYVRCLGERRLAPGVDDPVLSEVRHLCFRLAPRARELANAVSWLGGPLSAGDDRDGAAPIGRT